MTNAKERARTLETPGRMGRRLRPPDPAIQAFLAWVAEDMARRDMAELEMRRFAVPFLARKEETP